jgi:hypothetical protein
MSGQQVPAAQVDDWTFDCGAWGPVALLVGASRVGSSYAAGWPWGGGDPLRGIEVLRHQFFERARSSLFGREDDVAAVMSAGGAAGGRGLVFVEGHAGIGKTGVLRAAGERRRCMLAGHRQPRRVAAPGRRTELDRHGAGAPRRNAVAGALVLTGGDRERGRPSQRHDHRPGRPTARIGQREDLRGRVARGHRAEVVRTGACCKRPGQLIRRGRRHRHTPRSGKQPGHSRNHQPRPNHRVRRIRNANAWLISRLKNKVPPMPRC